MFRRWLTRAPLLLLWLLVITLWAMSHLGKASLSLNIKDRQCNLYSVNGLGIFHSWRSADFATDRHMFTFDRSNGARLPIIIPHMTLGFCLSYVDWPFGLLFTSVPLWFPTAMLTLLNIFVWRKRRPRPLPPAFPIAPTALTTSH